MSKQDRQGVRTPAALEQKYNFKSFAQATGSASEANRNAHEANAAVAELNAALNALVGELGSLAAELDSIGSRVEAVEAQSAYTAMMTDTLSTTLTKEKISGWYAKSLWTAAMVNKAVDKGVLTSDEATEITG